jgi:hypothetical protein
MEIRDKYIRRMEWRYRRDEVVGWRCSKHRELEWRYRRNKVVGWRFSKQRELKMEV